MFELAIKHREGKKVRGRAQCGAWVEIAKEILVEVLNQASPIHSTLDKLDLFLQGYCVEDKVD